MTGPALIAIAVLVLVNGFFVAAEFALVSMRPEQQLPPTRAGAIVRRQSERLDEYLSACQLGITIASLALGALGSRRSRTCSSLCSAASPTQEP